MKSGDKLVREWRMRQLKESRCYYLSLALRAFSCEFYIPNWDLKGNRN